MDAACPSLFEALAFMPEDSSLSDRGSLARWIFSRAGPIFTCGVGVLVSEDGELPCGFALILFWTTKSNGSSAVVRAPSVIRAQTPPFGPLPVRQSRARFPSPLLETMPINELDRSSSHSFLWLTCSISSFMLREEGLNVSNLY